MVIAMILGALGLVLGLSALIYSVHVAVVYDTFNKGIKAWSESLDDSMRLAIDLASHKVLLELDERMRSSNVESSDDDEKINLNSSENE